MESSTSEHIGKLRQRLNLNVKVTGITEKYDYSVIKTETPEGNKVYFYDKGFSLEAGQEISIKGTITKHSENLGIKVTYLNRVKIAQAA